MTPLKAIRAKCLDCCGGQAHEVKLCVVADCPLYPFRFGKNSQRIKREYTEEERTELASRFGNAQKNRESADETYFS